MNIKRYKTTYKTKIKNGQNPDKIKGKRIIKNQKATQKTTPEKTAKT